MAKVTLLIASTVKADIASGKTPGAYRYILHPVPNGSDMNADDPALFHDFLDVPPGDYIGYIQRRYDDGSAFGPQGATGTITVNEATPGAPQDDVVATVAFTVG